WIRELHLFESQHACSSGWRNRPTIWTDCRRDLCDAFNNRSRLPRLRAEIRPQWPFVFSWRWARLSVVNPVVTAIAAHRIPIADRHRFAHRILGIRRRRIDRRDDWMRHFRAECEPN